MKIKNNIDSVGHIFLTAFYSVLGFIVGVIVRLFAAPFSFDSINSLLWIFVPWGILGAIITGALAFKFPRIAANAICFIPGCDIG